MKSQGTGQHELRILRTGLDELLGCKEEEDEEEDATLESVLQR